MKQTDVPDFLCCDKIIVETKAEEQEPAFAKEESVRETTSNRIPLSKEERNLALFLKQKKILDTFLSAGAIDRRQYDKSLTCLTEKMGIPPEQRAGKTEQESNGGPSS